MFFIFKHLYYTFVKENHVKFGTQALNHNCNEIFLSHRLLTITQSFPPLARQQKLHHLHMSFGFCNCAAPSVHPVPGN